MSEAPSYIDYEAFLSPEFSPHSFANSLILTTNDPSDTTLDLSTPLSRVLFDIQEIDTHIHSLTTKSALPILEYIRGRNASASVIADRLARDMAQLNASHDRLKQQVLSRYEAADNARLSSVRGLEVLALVRGVSRALALARQLEIQVAESGLGVPGKAGKEDHRALVRAVYSILELRELLQLEEGGEQLQRVNVIKTLRTDLFAPVEERTRAKAQQMIREFSVSGVGSVGGSTTPSTPSFRPTTTGIASPATPTTFLQTEDAKARTSSAVRILYLLSPHPESPTLLLAALQTYMQSNLTASLASLARALTNLATLERVLLETSARCSNIVALETLLADTLVPNHPFLPAAENDSKPSPPSTTSDSDSHSETTPHPANPQHAQTPTLLSPLLAALDTSSLPSYFWRSLASALATRVGEIVSRGGAGARTLKKEKERVGGLVRECVLRTGNGKGWEREAAVMVGSVLGGLGR